MDMMSKRSITILLFISLAFNLAVVGSMLWVRYTRICPAPASQRMHQKRDLPPHLQDARLMGSPEISELHKQFGDGKLKLMRELAKDPIDEEYITTIIDSSLNTQSSLERALGNRLLDIRKQMSAAEAEDYFSSRADQMEQRTKAFRHKHHRRPKDEENNPN